MGSSSSTREIKGSEVQYYYLTYKPCCIVEGAIRGLLKCLGFETCTHERLSTQAQKDDDDNLTPSSESSSTTQEVEAETDLLTRTMQELDEVRKRGSRLPRPPRPSISSGSGPQINSTSSS
ncbi:Elicitor peptide [Dillenia turbinata]|uniref:Elicitor peptide n=1 Tax=Dillenia turbinata TaxID=194707 RepID=A0AAN8ZL82_9MAGN